MRTRSRRLLPPTAALLTLCLVAAGCTGGDGEAEGEGPQAAAERLAQGLADGDLARVAFTRETAEAVTEERAAVVEGLVAQLGEAEVAVEVVEVEEQEGSATATLAWSWPLGPAGEPWEYESSVRLTEVEGAWQAVWERAVVEPSLRGGTVLDATPIGGARGEILGARGLALVADRPVVRVGLDKARIRPAQLEGAARAMARLVGIEPAGYLELARAAGEEAFVEAIVLRSQEFPERVALDYDTIPGGMLINDDLPLAPSREFAAPILGTVGEVTADMIEEEPDRYEVGDVAGLSGLQARYDEQLQGTDGVVVDAVASDGRERELWRLEAQAGEPLRTTLDLDLQQSAERILAGVGPASAIVALRPSDGAVLAAANGPGAEGLNIATFGQYAPGSTFKTVSALALLRAGLTTSSPLRCEATAVVDGRQFGNYSDFPSSGLGQVPLGSALADSCNTAFINARDRLGDGDLAAAAAALGLGVDHDLGFPAYFGQVPPPESETEAAADLIGQGRVLASPMAMAAVAASVQAGRTVVPQLLTQVEAAPSAGQELAAPEAETLQGLLRGVVTDGTASLLAGLPGPPVLAKTGTAEYERDGQVRTHAWMIAAQGDLAVAVFVEDGASGSQTAGPLLAEFLHAAR
ncbi:penicillin-binding transpeptidase domain-containing protein [Nocardioides nanhaiensis]|uniref:penicillin-binding transpeptidase domain-containing protein n=1 Tax=Nocardioides nanhaiensis TaxID=1476871 RepID=UPI0031E70A98